MSDPDSLPNIALVVALIVGVFAILAGVDKALGWGAKPPGAVPVIAPPAVGPACPSCGRADPACSAYCSRCGGVLGGECASCGTERPPGGRFCRTCGEAFQGTAVSGVVGLAAPVPEFRPAAPAPALAATPSRSWFLHGLLVVVTLGCWFPVWFGLAWGDAKRAAGVAGMPGF